MADLPAIAELVPHQPPMLLLDELAHCSADSVVCRLAVRADGLFDRDGLVPAWLGIEYMAQAVAVFSGVEHWRAGEPTRIGFLLGTRRFHSNVSSLRVGQVLEVSAHRVIQGDNGMAAFECRLSGEGVEQTARLSVYEPAPAAVRAMLDGEQA